MNGPIFVDTNVLVCARDPSNPRKQRRAASWLARLWDEGSGRLSHQVLREFYVTMTRKLDPPADPEFARDDVAALATWSPVATGLPIMESAWRIEDRSGFSWWDALIAAARPVLVAVLTLLTACSSEPAADAGAGQGTAAEGAGASSDARPDYYYPGRLHAQAPDTFRARFETTAGDFTVEVVRDWAPRGADRFYNLVRSGWFDDQRIYRVAPGFVAQFGLHGDPVATYQWRSEYLVDDPVEVSNTRGRLAFAKSGPNSRLTEVFINLDDNPALDENGFSPFGQVVEGMEAVDAFFADYGDGPPRGDGPYQAQVRAEGNAYLDAEFPELTRIQRAVVED